MDPLEIILLLAIALLAVVLWRLLRPLRRCPQCRQPEADILVREPIGLRESSWGGGGYGGGHTVMQTTYHVQFRCARCGETWTDVITETT